MQFWRRKTLRRLTLLGVVVVGSTLTALLWPDADQGLEPGERHAGIVDTLGRDLPADHPALSLVDVSAEAGLEFRHFPATRSGQLPEDMGSGVALGDVDGDGWTDVFLCNLAGPLAGMETGWEGQGAACALFRNLGNGRFQEVGAAAGLDLRAMVNSACWADIDGDADLDLLVACYGSCRMFRNDGDWHFEEISAFSGVDAFHGFWSSLSVADYDLDGDLDFYVCGYVRYSGEQTRSTTPMAQFGTAIPARLNPSVFPAERNLLLRNRGDGRFDEVAAAAGVADENGRGLGAVFADLNQDGRPDLYVANDVSDNALFLNQGDGTFADYTAGALLGDYRGAMGMAVADYDRDLDFDLFITHWLAQENALYENVGRDLAEEGAAPPLLFMDEADRKGLGQIALEMVGWATAFVDLDNDGLRDLYVINGSTIPDADNPELLVPQRPQLFWNAGDARGFFEIGAVAGDFFRQKHVGRGGAHFDYDLDGDLDLLVMAHGEGAHLLQNRSGQEDRSVLLRLRQPSGNRYALGTTVMVEWGGQAMLDQVGCQPSYLSQSAVGELHFGLGDAGQIDRIEVRWPDGTSESGGPFAAGSLVHWTRGATPEVTALPGRLLALSHEPDALEDKRQFFALIREASAQRIGGELEAAVASYRQALQLWPGHWDCLYYLGNTLLEQGHEGEALETLRQLTFYRPQSNRAWMQIGRILLPGGDPSLDDLEAARAAFQRCLEINREESESVVQLGLVSILTGELDQADAYFADAAMLNNQSIEAPWFRGWIAFHQGSRDTALEFLARAHQLSSPDSGGGSTSNEGDTARGQAMTAQAIEATAHPLLHRWRTLSERPIDLELEYATTGAQE